jgi:hypothetical protein
MQGNKFITTLYTMINDNKNDIINWSPDGASFIINNRKEFEKPNGIHSNYYPKSKGGYATFLRSLGYYNFNTQYDVNSVTINHANFHRDHPENLYKVTRNVSKQNHTKKIKVDASGGAIAIDVDENDDDKTEIDDYCYGAGSGSGSGAGAGAGAGAIEEEDVMPEDELDHDIGVIPSSWPKLISDAPTYSHMSPFTKYKFMKMVVQYWVYQNVIDTADLADPSHFGKTTENIYNIACYISFGIWGINYKKNINFNEFMIDFELYIRDKNNTNHNDPYIAQFRSNFGEIKKISNISLVRKKEMYVEIVNYWISLKISNFNPNQIMDKIKKVFKSEINWYNYSDIHSFKSGLNKYIAGVSQEENANAVIMRNTTGFKMPMEYWVEKPAAPSVAPAPIASKRKHGEIMSAEEGDDFENSYWLKSARS